MPKRLMKPSNEPVAERDLRIAHPLAKAVRYTIELTTAERDALEGAAARTMRPTASHHAIYADALESAYRKLLSPERVK
jgi:hypothetical protein